MSGFAFVLALVRLAALACPGALASFRVRRAFTPIRGVEAALVDTVVALGVLILAAELLGLVTALRFGWLAGLLWLIALGALWTTRSIATEDAGAARHRPPAQADRDEAQPGRAHAVWRWSAVIVVSVVAGQWLLATANSLGGGMFSFDVLWYHMPFAASFAQSASVTHVQFTQADPFVAYYPATSELLDALGIVAFGNDFLSPLLNLGWLALALAASWSIGRRWRVELATLTVGATIVALPVLSGTQPGEAFNDIAGLAALLTAVALLASPDLSRLRLLAAGTALGLAAGTKYTFVVPAVVLVLGVPFLVCTKRLARTVLVGGAMVVSAGWWYLRALIDTGSPLGIGSRIGPLQLPGPRSPLADASQLTVLSQVHHVSLWGSRFIPGLAHAFGVFWPVILATWLVAIVLTPALIDEPFLRVVAVASALAGVSYLVFPTGASAIAQSSALFAVNLRYAVPALAPGLMLVPIVMHLRAPRWAVAVGPVLVLAAVAAQLEPSLWPTQTARHLAFLAVALVVLAAVTATLKRARRPVRVRPATLTGLIAATIVALAATGSAVQRHYLDERYRVGDSGAPGLGAIYAWAQTVADTDIGLYGTVEQYPLYGASDSNHVTYLGRPAPDGGYAPISTCAAWRSSLRAGGYRYVVLTAAPTTPVPLAWTAQDPDLKPVLHPAAGDWVFEATGASPARAPAGGC